MAVNLSRACDLVSTEETNALVPIMEGGWPELLARLLFSAVNYRFVNLSTLARPALGTLVGSQAFEQDLRRVCERFGATREGVARMAVELMPEDFATSVTSGICDPAARVLRLRFMASCIARHWDELASTWQAGDLDAVLGMAWFTGLFLDPFHKRLQHLAFALMRHVSSFHAHLKRADRLTILCDYRLPELLLSQGALRLDGDAATLAGPGCLRLRGSDPLVSALRAATMEIGEALASRYGTPQIVVDQLLWQRARSAPSTISLLIDTDAF